MIEKVMCVGCGQGGSKIADKFKQYGYQVAYLNLSANDLRALEYADSHEQLLIRGDGAGKDREYAKKMLDMGMVVKFFHEQLKNRDIKVIIFSFATGGGSGSGITPIIIEALKYEFPDIVFVAMPILPSLDESYTSQANTLEAIQELSDIGICVFPVDNQQINPLLPKFKGYEVINKNVVDLFNKLISYTEMDSKYQFDETDLLKILSESGNGIIADVDIAALNSTLTKEGITKMIQESWEKSVFAPIEYDYLTNVAVIFDGQETFLDQIDTDIIFSKFQIKPISLFNGIYKEQNGKVITVITGLPWCKKRLRQIEEFVEENREKIEIAMSNSNYRYESKAGARDILNKFNQRPTQKTSGKPDWRQLLDKYRK